MRFLLLALPLLWFCARGYAKAKPRRRPAEAWTHDTVWSSPVGRHRRRQFVARHRCICARCGAMCPELHHTRYLPGRTGQEPDSVFRWLCRRCHRKVHVRHDRWFPFDHWPYRRLRWVTDVTITTGRLWWRLWRRLPDDWRPL